MSSIKAVFFDIDGTLFDHPGAEKQVLQTFYNENSKRDKSHFDDFLQAWKEAQEIYYTSYAKGEISFAEHRQRRVQKTWEFFEKQIDLQEAQEIFDRYLLDYPSKWRLYPDSLPCLESLKGKYLLGVISNGQGELQRRKLKNCGLSSWFPVVVISGELGVSKPEPRIFLEACQQIGVPPKEAAYVGDRLDIDAEAAENTGLRGIWLARYGEPAKTNLPKIETLKNLSSYL